MKRALTELLFAQRDLVDVIRVQEDMAKAGHRTPRLGTYVDQLYAVEAEIKARRAQ
jgi:hypothetical protein